MAVDKETLRLWRKKILEDYLFSKELNFSLNSLSKGAEGNDSLSRVQDEPNVQRDRPYKRGG